MGGVQKGLVSSRESTIHSVMLPDFLNNLYFIEG